MEDTRYVQFPVKVLNDWCRQLRDADKVELTKLESVDATHLIREVMENIEIVVKEMRQVARV